MPIFVHFGEVINSFLTSFSGLTKSLSAERFKHFVGIRDAVYGTSISVTSQGPIEGRRSGKKKNPTTSLFRYNRQIGRGHEHRMHHQQS
ncbi:hypothetical protein BGZ63DRAFT_372696 [Mariannaea sp. PMI_226]|nr:hypothetical protein BGZ63DRAFT_372696 [Mariannaea sp. PMI_226]